MQQECKLTHNYQIQSFF